MTELVETKKNHLWAKGVSGNPAGRPRGSKNAISLIKLQIEGELRAQMKGDMRAVLAEIVRQALPTERQEKDGSKTIVPGNLEAAKLLYKSWVSGTVASDEDAPKDKIQIVIGKLDQIPEVKGRAIVNKSQDEE